MLSRFKYLAISIGILLISQNSMALQKYYGPTTPDERLWNIANFTRPSNEVSTQQMALAIFKANPKAFNKNMNMLYTGVRLRIPNYEEIQKINNNPIEFVQSQQPTVNTVLYQQEIADLNQQIKEMKQQTDNRLTNLEVSHDSIHHQLNGVANRVNAIFNTVALHGESINKLVDDMNHTILKRKHMTQIALSLSEIILGSIVVILLAMIVGLTYSLFRQKPSPQTSPKPQKTKPLDDEEDEYDFINSAEGIPAKLNLARAYIEMENRESALKILEEVLAEGSQEHKNLATKLIKYIKTPIEL